MKIDKIVVGVDFSEGAEVALQWAIEIGRHAGAEVVLAYATDVREPHEGMSAPSEFEEFVRAELKKDRERLAQLTDRHSGSVQLSHVVVDGPPGVAVVTAASELGADLVVVGSHGRTGLQHFLLGSVAERIVRGCKCDVLVARPIGAKGSHRKRILVPTDFSDCSDAALAAALALVEEGGEVELFHAWNLPATAEGFYATDGAALHDCLTASIEARGKALVDANRTERCELSFAHANRGARAAIVREAEGRQFDMVVMGSHGRRGPSRWLLGSVAEGVVRHAHCSVWVARDNPAGD